MKNLFSLFLVFIIFCPVNVLNGQSIRPNILVILSDDHTQQAISIYGNQLMQTPNIDRIAKEGAIFTNSFVTNSICAPSRAVFLTGKYSHINGLKDNSPERYFDGSQQQVQKFLHEQKYQTAWIGKWHLQSLPEGFDYWNILPDQGSYYQPDFIQMNKDTVRHEGYVTNLLSDFSISWLNQRDTSSPFFLVIGEKATHRNWMPDIQDLGAFDDREFPLPANFYDDYTNRIPAGEQDMTINKTMLLEDDLKVHQNFQGRGMYGRLSSNEKLAYQNYYDKISAEYDKIKKDSLAIIKWKYQRYLKDYLSTAKSLDRNIGRILHYLDSMKLDRNTIVIYTSDQGFYMGEHGWFDKRFMYEESLRTPLVMKFPGVIVPGTRVNEMVVNIDLAPSILDVAGVKKPVEMQGRSFISLLKNPHASDNWRKSLYYHYYEYPEPHRVSPHFGIRTERYKLIRFYGPHDNWELYDLKTDPQEMKNLYADPKFKSIADKLKNELLQLAIEYKDTDAINRMKQDR
jgi:arylsulfatase A-like enzyme